MSDGDGSPSWRERGYTRLRELVGASRSERIVISVVALFISIIIGMVFVFLSGAVASCAGDPAVYQLLGYGLPLELFGLEFCYDPINVFYVLIEGSLTEFFGLALTLQATAILLLTGLSVAISFRAGLFNIGTQGQMVLGALAAGVVGPRVVEMVTPGAVGGAIVLGVSILAAAVAGGIWGMLPGLMKAYADANEVITTIMLNIIATGIAITIVRDVLGNSNIQTESLPEWAMFRSVLLPTQARFSTFVLLATVLLTIGFWYLLKYSSFGYNLRVSGIQPDAAEYSGVDSNRVVVATMTIAGVLGGLAGAAFVLMAQGYWADGLPAYGFDGITVSVLAANSPAGLIPASLLFGTFRSGTIVLQLGSRVPPEIIDVLRGIIILLVAMPEGIRQLAIRWGIEPPEATEEVAGVSADD